MLSEAQVNRLADRLLGTSGNVFNEAEAMFGEKPGQEVFGQLFKANAVKCVECNRWLPIHHFYIDKDSSDEIPMACVPCLNGDED